MRDPLLHPKNLALLAIASLDLPADHPCRVIVVQGIDGRSRVVTVLVEIPDGPGCEVLIDDADDIGSLADKIGRAIAMVLDAQRRALHQCSLWADQHPLALQDPVDPAIRTVDGRPLQYSWGLPAGWVPVMNRLHTDLADLLDYYEVTTVGNKLSYLRVSLDMHCWRDKDPDVRRAARDLLLAAREESLRTCDLCGCPAEGTVSAGVTRCEGHPVEPWGLSGATARPPGWRTPSGGDQA
ncbi:hypothetical protein [Salana multivorans]